MEMAFNIHQELWHDAWVAATAAVRSRKRQVDLDVEARVRRLIEDHGPKTGAPLTLRVYGTMLKGFCVINNERARTLYTECERVVVLFAQRPFAEDSTALKLPAAKRQRVDALTLDLDLAKVRENDAFDWTQTPLEEGIFLQVPGTQELLSLPTDEPLMGENPSVDVGMLLDESFPALEASAVAQVNAVAEAMRAAEAANAAAMQEASTALGQCNDAEGAGAPGNAGPAEPAQEIASLQRRPFFPRGVPPMLNPGQVYGFDEEAVMSSTQYDAWQSYTHDIDDPRRSLLQSAGLVQDSQATLDRHGSLRSMFWPPPEFVAHLTGVSAAALQSMECALVIPPEHQAAQSATATAQPGQAQAAAAAKESRADGQPDPFRPYEPEKPFPALQDVDAELAQALVPQGTTEAEAEGANDAGYDAPTARVCAVLRRCVQAAEDGGAGRQLTFDDVAPPGTTDPASAARMFSALLTLATAGEFGVSQPVEYGPIRISSE